MRTIFKMLALTAVAWSTGAQAGLISGFEQGLNGWDHIGDVSIQTASVGLAATQAQHYAFLTTLSTAANTPGPETPYSSTNSPSSATAREFLGIQTVTPPGCCGDPYMVGFPMADTTLPNGGTAPYAIYGESAAIKTKFTANRPGFVSFDWDRIGADGDNAYFTIWSDTPGTRINGWIYDYHTSTESFSYVDVGLCEHTYAIPSGCQIYNTHTGWHTLNIQIDAPGDYWIGFGMNEIAEGSTPTILALDNVRFTVPEPATNALLLLAFGALLVVRRPSRRN